ncbi:MAG: hypothetical protein JWQ18_693, partial [Conexibacter sp.]|nr:hypothetical protein [Conexibacter sp.]
ADKDGLSNLAEQSSANDPGDADSDDDGVKDGAEHAGQVVSFSTDGTLQLRLATTGKVVTGTVDGDTSVECNGVSDYELGYDDTTTSDTSSDDTGDDPSSDDDTGDDGSDDPGDDSSDGDATTSSSDDGGDAPSATASAASDDDPSADDGSDDSGDDDAGDDAGETSSYDATDPCIDEVLTAGSWVHEAALSAADDGSNVFDAVALVDATP